MQTAPKVHLKKHGGKFLDTANIKTTITNGQMNKQKKERLDPYFF